MDGSGAEAAGRSVDRVRSDVAVGRGAEDQPKILQAFGQRGEREVAGDLAGRGISPKDRLLAAQLKPAARSANA